MNAEENEALAAVRASNQAADETSTLRAENARMKEELSTPWRIETSNRWHATNRENARLRELLKSTEAQAEAHLQARLRAERTIEYLAAAANSHQVDANVRWGEASKARERAGKAEARVKDLEAAGKALYHAGHWTADRPVDAAALWMAMRDALGLVPGTSPAPTVPDSDAALARAEKAEARVKELEVEAKTDGPVYTRGRSEGRADVAAYLRSILDPGDMRHWDLDGVLGEVRRLAGA